MSTADHSQQSMAFHRDFIEHFTWFLPVWPVLLGVVKTMCHGPTIGVAGDFLENSIVLNHFQMEQQTEQRPPCLETHLHDS